MTRKVVEISRASHLAKLDDGRLIPVTDWFDAEGRRTGPGHAVTALAGEEGVGRFRVDMAALSAAVTH